MHQIFRWAFAAVFLSVWVAGTPIAARADAPMSAHELYVACKSKWADKAYLERYAACRGYISGIADILRAGVSVASHQACIPADATKGQIASAVVELLRNQHYERPGPNPDNAGDTNGELPRDFVQKFRNKSNPAANLVVEALARRFPC